MSTTADTRSRGRSISTCMIISVVVLLLPVVCCAHNDEYTAESASAAAPKPKPKAAPKDIENRAESCELSSPPSDDDGATSSKRYTPSADFNLRPIDRHRAEDLPFQDFIKRYHKKNIPVIITNATESWRSSTWNLSRLKQVCTRHSHLLEKMPAVLAELASHPLIDELEKSSQDAFNLTLDEILQARSDPKTFRDILDVPESEYDNESRDFSSVAHYLWPINFHDKLILHLCPELFNDVYYPKYLPRRPAHTYQSIWNKALHPRIFVAQRNSRAYPTHSHSNVEFSMLHIIEGKKHFVGWNYEHAEHLYPFARLSETQEPIYEANPFTQDSTQQPNLKKAWGWEGIAEAGDLLFVPKGIHIVHNIEPVLAIGFVHTVDNDVPWKRAKEENVNEQEAHQVLTQNRNEGTEHYNEPYRYEQVLMQNPNEGIYAKDYLRDAYCAHGSYDAHDVQLVYAGLKNLGSAPDRLIDC